MKSTRLLLKLCLLFLIFAQSHQSKLRKGKQVSLSEKKPADIETIKDLYSVSFNIFIQSSDKILKINYFCAENP